MAIADQYSNPSLLDVSDAIARVMGDRALYARMVTRFRKDYACSTAPIRAAIDGGDVEQAHRLAHTLKGASGMISAHALHQQASLLEIALRDPSASLAEPVAGVERALAQVLQIIECLLECETMGTPAQAQPARPGEELIEDLIPRLAALLASGDGAAMDLLDQGAASLKAALGEPGFLEVEQAANDFDFDGALDALRRWGGSEVSAAP
jgi:HPt (histidine-containing phosphotransfer) domain-containing protein